MEIRILIHCFYCFCLCDSSGRTWNTPWDQRAEQGSEFCFKSKRCMLSRTKAKCHKVRVFISILFLRNLMFREGIHTESHSKKDKAEFKIYLFIYLSLIQYIPTTASPSSLPSSTLLIPSLQIHNSSNCLQKRAALPVISAKLGITRGNETRHIPSYQGWIRGSSRRK